MLVTPAAFRRPATRCTRWPSTCSRRGTARRSTSGCARRPAGSGRRRSATTRSRASTAIELVHERAGRSPARSDHDARAPRPSSSACRSGAPPRLHAGNARPIPTRRSPVDADGRARRSPSGTRSRTIALAELRRRHDDQDVDRRPALARALRPRDRARRPRPPGRAPTTARRPATTRSPSRTCTSGRGTRRGKTGPARRYPFGAAHDVLRAAATRRSRGAPRATSSMACAQARARPGCGHTRVAWRHDADVHPHGSVHRRAVGGHRRGDRPNTSRVSPTARSSMLRSLAEITDGFAVDQLTHSLQTATRAERGGADPRDGVRVVAARHRQGRERAEPSRRSRPRSSSRTCGPTCTK